MPILYIILCIMLKTLTTDVCISPWMKLLSNVRNEYLGRNKSVLK